jgi:hypothetical protein
MNAMTSKGKTLWQALLRLIAQHQADGTPSKAMMEGA